MIFFFPSAQHLTEAPGRLFSPSQSVAALTETRTCAFGAHKMVLKDFLACTHAQRHPAGCVCSWDLSSTIVISKDSKVWNQSRLLHKSNNLSLWSLVCPPRHCSLDFCSPHILGASQFPIPGTLLPFPAGECGRLGWLVFNCWRPAGRGGADDERAGTRDRGTEAVSRN